MLKRAFDIAIAGAGLLVLSPCLLLTALLVKLTSPGPILFRQERMGRDFQPFQILKFRTMVHNPVGGGRQITAGRDPRITRVGQILRLTKLDELPQLWNVFRGDMSLVGPRPEVRKYVEQFAGDYRDILQIRPGITDPASIKFRHESELLGQAEDPEREYVERILPEKIALAKEYIATGSFLGDLAILGRTLLRILPAFPGK